MTYQQLIQRSLTHRLQQRAVDEVLQSVNMTPSDFMVLALIHDGDHNASSLSKILDSSRAFVTNRVNSLEDSGWVKRVIGNDSRVRRIAFVGDEAKYKALIKALKKVEL